MRRQLLALIGTTTVVVLAVLLVPLALLVRSHAEDRAMTDATERAQSVAAVVGGSLGRGAGGREVVQGVVDGLNGRGQPRTSVVLADDTVLGRRTGGVSADALKLARGGRAFTYAPRDGHGGGRVVMVPVLASGAEGKEHGRVRPSAHSASVVEVAVSEDQLHAGVLPSWLAVFGLGVALMLLGLAFADRLAARLVRATRQLAFVSDRLAGGELTARRALGPARAAAARGAAQRAGRAHRRPRHRRARARRRPRAPAPHAGRRAAAGRRRAAGRG